MFMLLQYLIVAGLILWALLVVYRKVSGAFSKKSACGGSCNCGIDFSKIDVNNG